MIKKIDKRARERGYLTYKSNELYVKQLSRNAYVFVQRNGKSFMAYRITFGIEGSKSVSEKTIVKSTDIVNAFKRTEAYISRYWEYINDLQNEII